MCSRLCSQPTAIPMPVHTTCRTAARACVPDLVLHSDLAKLSRFAGGDAYGNPDLDIDPEQMLISVRSDVARLFDIFVCEVGFDPWTCRKIDYQRGV